MGKKRAANSIKRFVSRPYFALTQQEWDRVRAFEEVDYEDPKYDDPKYNWKICYLVDNDQKYGRIAISEEYRLKRGLTMGEFYGNSPVD